MAGLDFTGCRQFGRDDTATIEEFDQRNIESAWVRNDRYRIYFRAQICTTWTAKYSSRLVQI